MDELVVHVLLRVELTAGGNLHDVGGEVVGASGEVDVGSTAAHALPRLEFEGVAVDGVRLVDGDTLALYEVGVRKDAVIRIELDIVAHGWPPWYGIARLPWQLRRIGAFLLTGQA